jgi:hypothetical protein
MPGSLREEARRVQVELQPKKFRGLPTGAPDEVFPPVLISDVKHEEAYRPVSPMLVDQLTPLTAVRW